jgi:hypothetical protein
MNLAILIAAGSKAQVCGRLLAGIASSNPAGGIDVLLLGVGINPYPANVENMVS